MDPSMFYSKQCQDDDSFGTCVDSGNIALDSEKGFHAIDIRVRAVQTDKGNA